jgi:C4-dicarboxylate transporter, DcuC family
MLPALLIILAFVILALLMVSKKLPTLLALPIMAVVTGLIAALFSGLPLTSKEGSSVTQFIFLSILTEGSIKLAKAMMYAIFGAILSQVVLKTGIAERIVKTAAELAGDKKMIVALFLTTASALVFSSLTGLGGFIMIGTLVLPVMIAAGLSAQLASSLLLFSLAVGGIFNAANWGFYESALKVDLSTIKTFSVTYGIMLAVVTIVFMVIEVSRDRIKFAWSLELPRDDRRVPPLAFLTPILPVILILNPWYHWDIIPAFMVAALYGVLTTDARRSIATITAATIEGLKDIGPVLGLFIGIGMVLNAVMDPITSQIMKPLLSAIIPHGKIGYILFFGLLAPLALYRGPLNLWGLGTGIAALLIGSDIMPPVAVMGAFLASGQIQSICDPTNTHNVWLAQYMKITTEDLLRKTLLYVWIFVFLGLFYAVFIRGVL